VTDIVDEQVGSGEVEPAPTPAAGGEAEHPAEEVTEKGGIEQVDQGLEELQLEDEAEKTESEPAAETAEAGQAATESQSATPQVTEEETKIDSEAMEQTPAAAASPEARKQERVENPRFTLETVGNKYNTGNFW
jgi:capping protein alpha